MRKIFTKLVLALFGLIMFANFAMGQTVLFQDGFESGNLNNWTLIDSDRDNNNWYAGNSKPHTGSYHAISFSWYGGYAYNPDNWMISPLVTGATSIRYFVYTSAVWPDNYAIMASSTGNNISDFSVVFEETLPDTITSWTERIINLPAGTKYVAFRHYNSENNKYLYIDDVTITSGGGGSSSCPPVTNLTATGNSDNTVTLKWTNPPSSQWPSGCTGDLYFKFYDGTASLGSNDNDNLTSWTTPVLTQGTHNLGVNLSYWGNSTTQPICYSNTVMVSVSVANVNMNRWIELTVQQGQWIQLDLSADAANTKVKVVSGTKDTTLTVGTTWTGNIGYYAQTSTMKVYGNVNMFDCSQNGSKITGLNASNNIGLTSLHCYNNNLSSLDLSGLTALKSLSCYFNSINYINLTGCSALEYLQVSDNNLSSLDITDCSALKSISLHSNNFSTQALDDIFCMLPTRLPSDEGFIYVLRHPTDDPNIATVMATNKKNANDRFWSVINKFNGDEIPATTGDYACQELENYPLWVGGVQVTSLNASNITGSGITGGVSYDSDSKTLTLNNATITGYHAVGPTINQSLYNIYSNDNININVIGTNSLELEKNVYDDQLWGYGIYAYNSGYKDVNLMGYGTLNIGTNVYSDYGPYENYSIIGDSIFLNGTITLNINSSDYGIYAGDGYISVSKGVALEITTDASISGNALVCDTDQDVYIEERNNRIILEGNNAASATQVTYLTMTDNGEANRSKPYVKIEPSTSGIVNATTKGIDVWGGKGYINIEANSGVSSTERLVSIYDLSGRLVCNAALTSEGDLLSISIHAGIYIVRIGNSAEKVVVW